jgi:hypothetical protein
MWTSVRLCSDPCGLVCIECVVMANTVYAIHNSPRSTRCRTQNNTCEWNTLSDSKHRGARLWCSLHIRGRGGVRVRTRVGACLYTRGVARLEGRKASRDEAPRHNFWPQNPLVDNNYVPVAAPCFPASTQWRKLRIYKIST